MLRSIQDFLWSLKSEKSKRREMEKAFAAVGEPPDEKLHRLKAVGRWLKKHVLAAVVSGLILVVLSTILVFYIERWLSPPQEESPPQSPPKAMPV